MHIQPRLHNMGANNLISPCALVMYNRIYVADMRLKKVSKCIVTSEKSILNRKEQGHAHVAQIPLVSVFRGSGVVGSI